MNTIRTFLLGATCLAVLGSGVPVQAQPRLASAPTSSRAAQSSQSVFEVLSTDPRFVTTLQMFYIIGAANRLMASNNVTVFAPTNTSWGASSHSGLLSSLSSPSKWGSTQPDADGITDVLRGLFVVGQSTSLNSRNVHMQSLAGRAIDFDAATKLVTWIDAAGERHSAHLAGAPILANNGVIVPIDAIVGG